ncbi:MAG: class I SAM-dependent DNA methyltransferase, partial [Cellvibrionales bacterium]|nr:class I SAM-dependent DNA methyltransferase [Cellvibrionales bacterium]
VEQQGTPLKDWDIQIFRGVITGCNEAFIIDRKKRDELIAADVNSSAIIKPILRGKDIKRYQVNFADWYVIIAKFGSYKTLKSEYPAIYQHLKSYEQKLKSRGQCRYTRSGKIVGDYPGQHHWLELDNNPKQEYLDIFTKPKIIYPSMTQYLPFYYDGDGAFFINDKAFILSGDKEILPYLTALLNSSLFRCCFKENFAALGEKGRELRKIFIEKIPLKKPTP